MHQLIDQPTRVDDKTSFVLDVILTSHPALHRKSSVLKYTVSDHYLIYTHMEFENTKQSVLDVILTSHPALHRKSSVLKYTLSDHYLIYTHMEFENTKQSVVDQNTVKFRDMKKFRYGEFLQLSNFM